MKKQLLTVCFVFLSVYGLFLACSYAKTVTPITEDVIYHASYPNPKADNNPAQISFNGKNKDGEPYSYGKHGDPDYLTAEIYNTAFGDLDGNHAADATVIIGFNYGGSGMMIAVYAVIGTEGKPMITKPVVLGDRVMVNSVRIVSGKIILDTLTHGPDDPSCCPSVKKILSYRVSNGKLIGSR